MRIRTIHMLPNQTLCYTSMTTFKDGWTVIENEGVQLLMRHVDTDLMVEVADHFTPDLLLNMIKESMPLIEKDYVVIKLFLN